MLLAISVIVMVFGVVAVAMFLAKRRADALNAQWVTVYGRSLAGFLIAADTADAERARIDRAVDLAVQALVTHATWGNNAPSALIGVRIGISATETWDVNGQQVAGQSFLDGYPTVLVGPSLAALCHEFGHVAEDRLFHAVDYSHASWKTNGMEAAQAEYARQLLTRA